MQHVWVRGLYFGGGEEEHVCSAELFFQGSSSPRPWSLALALPGDNLSADKSLSCTGLPHTAIVLGEYGVWMDDSSKSETQQ